MDLSKAFNTINYELLVVKLNIYGFSKEIIFRYLNNRTQGVKINKTFSSLGELLYGVLLIYYLCWGHIFLIHI